MKITILISKTSWANEYKAEIKKILKKYSKVIKFKSNHKLISKKNDINIIFSYFSIIDEKYLKRSKYNIIPHESDLPEGKGMSPLTWQIIKGQNKIVFSLIEAEKKMDCGEIYFKKKIKIKKNLLFDEIKKIQFHNNMILIKKFIDKFKKDNFVRSKKQTGNSTYYKKRKAIKNKININKSIKSQFDIMRVSDNSFYPNFFYYRGRKFYLKIKV
jgi:methionyl-tRNA formyltransferase